MRITGNIETARDAVQETFLRLCKQDRAKVIGHEAPWLYRVCRTRALDILRKEKPVTPLTSEQETRLPSDGRNPADQASSQDAQGFIPRLMAGLPERQQEVIRLKFQQQLSYREIAETLELSESNVGYLIHTGIKTMREHMQTIEGNLS